MKDPSIKILSALCRRAEEGCARRLDAILERADPGDPPLRRYLTEIVREQKDCLDRARRLDSEAAPPVSWAPEEARTQELLSRFFPSASRRLGEGPLGREAALYFVECLEEENALFLRELATRAPEGLCRTFFREMAEGQESRQRKCREVLL